MTKELRKTIFCDRHLTLKARMTDFGGWCMPLQYPTGIIEEHLATRNHAGLFDVSHMGRFVFCGKGALTFLQHILTNNAAALNTGMAQYTIIPNQSGGAIDDAYLYRFFDDEYILVVNAGNKEKDWNYLQSASERFDEVEMVDRSEDLAMVSLQGPLSETMLKRIISPGLLPETLKNRLSVADINGASVLISRTGYTGEPLGFELFVKRDNALRIWDMLIEKGATPVGLGARDTLRLEAGLPLYGHELGYDPEGKEIPVFSCPLSRFAVSFSPLKENFVGRDALMKQSEAFKKIRGRDYSLIGDLPKLIIPLTLVERGVARAGFKVFSGQNHVGHITSGTTVPYYEFEGEGIMSKPTNKRGMRSICLALVDSALHVNDKVNVEIRGEKIRAVIVPFHLRSEASLYARPLVLNRHNPAQAQAIDKE